MESRMSTDHHEHKHPHDHEALEQEFGGATKNSKGKAKQSRQERSNPEQ